MSTRRAKTRNPFELSGAFPGDRRDRRPGTHFAAELGSPPTGRKKRGRGGDEPGDPHVDEDLGVSAFGIELPFLRR